jgi:glycosyltransferase involved in cell wall biosynthesis
MELSVLPRVSVIIATYNPRREVIAWALDLLARQTMPKSEFEVVVSDNGSEPPLDEAALNGSRGLRLRVVREPRHGVTYARCTGILAAENDLLLFVDDDNGLDPDYLETAARIAVEWPQLGAFGGIAQLRSDVSLPKWKENLLPWVGVRDYGTRVITSAKDVWGPWEPIGAGMAFRRDIGLEFVRAVQTDPLARALGRNGKSFIAGEDSLLARLAYRLGYTCSYQPALKLTHWIKSSRLTASHLAKTVEGLGRAFVIWETVLGRPQPDYSALHAIFEIAKRLRHRIREKGARTGAIEWCWDLGYFRQARLLHRSEEWRYEPQVLHRHSEL